MSQKEEERDKTCWSDMMIREEEEALERIRNKRKEESKQQSQQTRSTIVSHGALQKQQDEEGPMVVANGHTCSPPDENSSCVRPPPRSVPSPMEQRTIILRLLAGLDGHSSSSSSSSSSDLEPSPPVVGEAYYLIDARWWRSWCRHVDFFRDAELEEARRAFKQAADSARKKIARDAQVSVVKARLLASRLLPPGAFLDAPTACKNQDGNAKRSSSSYEEGEDDEWLEVPAAFGPLPRTIDNSLLILNTDGIGKVDAHDEFFTKWCRPSYGKYGGLAAAAANSATSASVASQQENQSQFVRLRPNLVRGHHFECLPRGAYEALTCWYGEKTAPIRRRATASPNNTDSGQAMARLLLYPELQHGETGTLSPTWSGSKASSSAAVQCGECKTPGARKKCGQCLSVSYCREECQINHWGSHKTKCQTIAGCSRKEVLETITIEDSSEWGRIGLNNLGNTCFMNSALQCLSHSAPLTKYFLLGRFKIDLNPDNPLGAGGKLALAYEEVIKALWMNRGSRAGCISPTSMKLAIASHASQFDGANQHDSHEFITYLLDVLHEDLNRVRDAPYVEMPDALPGQKLTIAGAEAWDLHRRRNDSLVMDTFFGQFRSTCVCPRCQAISVSYDAFKDVSLQIPALQKMQDLNSRRVTLNQCFETFSNPEQLDESNQYYCSSCRDHVRATKTMELWRLPNVLVVHLKRFEFRNADRSKKDETFVDFPLEGLDMSRYCAHPNATVPSSASAPNSNGGGNKGDDSDFVVDSIPAIYDLFGVVNHYGRMGSGHYTAYARCWDENGMDKEWALFDDSCVRDVGDGKTGQIGDGMIVTPAAYVLFYRRRVFT